MRHESQRATYYFVVGVWILNLPNLCYLQFFIQATVLNNVAAGDVATFPAVFGVGQPPTIIVSFQYVHQITSFEAQVIISARVVVEFANVEGTAIDIIVIQL